MTKTKETYSYKGWLISDNFWKRAFAVYGYSLIASLAIIVPIYALLFLLIVLVGV